MHNKKKYNIQETNSKFFYDVLIGKKAEKNYMESAWSRNFNIDNINWENIYNNQIWRIRDRKLSEFNYKILCNILCTRSVISKWNKNVNENCRYCNQRHTVRHLLYECSRVHNLWILIGSILRLDITYRHIVLGNIVTNDFLKNRNLLISYVAYAIYKFWILSENNKLDFNSASLINFVKHDIFRRSLYLQDESFNNICDKLVKNM